MDTHFPWKGSGFRYDEALALHELRPDTLFFSLWELTDPFPAPVHALAEFPLIAPAQGITDVYAVFLNTAGGLLGELAPSDDRADLSPVIPPNLSSVLDAGAMRLHVGLYPGGGFTLSDERLEQAERVARRSTTVFSWVPEVAALQNAVAVPPAIINTDFYAPAERDWQAEPLRVVFAADGAERKGIDVALAGFERLGDGFELDVIGPHADWAGTLRRPDRVRFHGWQSPVQLRDHFARAHVFLSPVRTEPDGAGGAMVDGFPTTTASSAAATGCLLVSGNPRQDHTVLTPGVTHLELQPADAEGVAAALEAAAADRPAAQRLTAAGQAAVRAHLDVRRAMRWRLERLGLLDAAPGD